MANITKVCHCLVNRNDNTMFRETRLSPEMVDALEQAIREAVQERIDTDPDVADCYLRIIPNNWLVQVMYIEESNLTTPNRDVALLNLMYDLKDSYGGNEIWILNDEAIHDLAESYKEMLEMDLCLN